MAVTANLADGTVLNFPDGVDPSVVKATVQKYTSNTKPADKTSPWEDVKIGLGGVASLADTGVSLAGAALSTPFTSEETRDDIFKNLNERQQAISKWSNPEGKEQGLSGKLISAIPAAAGIPLAGFALPSTGKEALDKGESLGTALKAGGVDAASQALAAFIPLFGKTLIGKMLSTGAVNAAQNTAAEAAISSIANTKEMKQAHNPWDRDKAIVSAVSGAAFAGAQHALRGGKGKPSNTFDDKLDDLISSKKVEESATKAEVFDPSIESPTRATMRVAEQNKRGLPTADDFNNRDANVRAVEEEIAANQARQVAEAQSAADSESTRGQEFLNAKQMQIDDHPHGDRPAQYGFTDTGGRIDENGIPIRADLSMEAQQLQDPLQRNLWGDELPPKAEQELANAPGLKIPRSQFGGNQRGGIDLDLLTFGLASKLEKNLDQKQKMIEEMVGKKHFTPPPSADNVISVALAEGRDGKGINSIEAGATLAGEKRNSALIKGFSRIVQHYKNISEDGIKTSVFPAENKLRKLSSNELVQLSQVMKKEMFNRIQLSDTDLASLGLSTKQLIAYNKIREMHQRALDVQNAARVAQGKKPITAEEAYLSSRWSGDFRRAIHDKEGKLVWYLASDTKMGLNSQSQALMKKFPDLVVGEHADHTTKSIRGINLNAAEMYSMVVDVLGRDDPAVAKIKDWVEESAVDEGRGMLAQEKHFKHKAGVRGFVGDRPSNTFFGKLNHEKEALALFQEQINYAKNAHKWSALQEAGQEVKKIFSNEDLQKQQPHNLDYVRDYYRNQIGLGTAKAIAGLEDGFKATGISPTLINSGISNVKNLWITQKLVASAGFLASNTIQAANMAPHIADIMVKHGGNPITALSAGLSAGTLMALGHINIAHGKKNFYQLLATLPKEQSQFFTKVMKYAEDNSVTSKSIYDETPIASSFSGTKRVVETAGATISFPETLLRSISFMTYATLLKSSGKFTDDMKLLRLAEERTNMSMGDYREGEKAMLFNKLGITGNMANTLMTFPINYYNQWGWAGREALRGNAIPAAVMFGTQAYVAGAMGVPGFADTDKLWNFLKDLMAKHSPKMWDKVKHVDLKQMVLGGLGSSGLYGGLSEQTGVSLTSRASAPAGSEMAVSPFSPLIDLGSQALDVGNAALHPTDPQKAAQALYNVLPTGGQGAAEVGILKDQTSVVNPKTDNRIYGSPRDMASREGQIERTKEEERLRAFGFKSQRETKERDAAYTIRKLDAQTRGVINELPGRIYNELRKNNKDEVRELAALYTRLSGTEITSEQIENEAVKEYTTGMTKSSMNSKTVPGMLEVARMRKFLEEEKKK